MSDDTEDITDAGDCGPLGCQPSLEDIFLYMDGVMSEMQRAGWSTHLSDCGDCEQVYDLQRSFRHLVEMRCQADLPPDLAQRIFRTIGLDLIEIDGPGEGRAG